MAHEFEAYLRWAHYYREFGDKHSSNFASLDYELLQIQAVLNWLSTCVDKRCSEILLSLIGDISSYFEQRSLNNLLLQYVKVCLKAAEDLEENPGWIYLIAYRTNWALGRWDDAGNYINLALETTPPNTRDYATILRSLGSFQLNRGNYQEALRTFSKAKLIYHYVGDSKGESLIQAEEAAYYLNKAEYSTAYQLYSEVMRFEQNYETRVSDHTLLMMGIALRRLKDYQNSIEYLSQLMQRAESSHSQSAYATSAHHLAWTYIDQGVYEQAKKYAELAKVTYNTIADLRGSSDSDEQLGLIAIALGNYYESQVFLGRSMTIRKKLGNQQGYASSIRRMAKLRFAQGHLLAAIYYLVKSLYLYYKIGMLPVSRIIRFVGDIFSKRLVS